ncbi:hypothetical protein A5742_15455 [Mycolicibacterium fortuitum]|uniref:Uncharacterized protein n=1 Tax=Mycolicibacterium fortuitum TaxID=1766 RepID=A0ABD6QC40_MYCFO|nr:hypothetical protein A5742_15455 [Mycolicibacterium fortuitum]
MKRNTIRTPRQGWEYWRLNRIDDDSIQWLAISRAAARAVIDRCKVWTLMDFLIHIRCKRHRDTQRRAGRSRT